MEAVDFDPLTEEGREDLNNIADEEFDYLIPKEGETGESWNQRLFSRFRSNTSYLKRRLTDLFKTRNPGKAVPEYMELQNMDVDSLRTDTFAFRDDYFEERKDELVEKFPDLDKNLFKISLDKEGKLQISFFSARLNDF